jgi:hypothetical protein
MKGDKEEILNGVLFHLNGIAVVFPFIQIRLFAIVKAELKNY